MPIQGLDDFAAPLQWAAFDAAEVPSALITLNVASVGHPHAVASDSMTITVNAGAAGHVFRRALPPTSLTDAQELALWARADQPIGTAADAPVRVRLELGSAALPVGDPANLWHRYLSVPTARDWAYQRFALDDLAPAVRSAVTSISVTIANSDVAATLAIDGLEAHRRTLFSDCEAALTALLHNRLTIAATPVPAVLAPDLPANAALPHFVVSRVKASPNALRAQGCGTRSDFTDAGYRLRPAPEPWDIHYAIDSRAGTAADVALLNDFLGTQLDDGGWLRIGNRAWRMDIVDWATVMPDMAVTDNRLLLRIAGWQDRGAGTAVRPADEVVLGIGPRTAIGEFA